MTKRPHIPLKVKVSVAIRQAQHGEIVCPLCHTGIRPEDEMILEHMVAREFYKDKEFADQPGNLAWVHKDCAAIKTNGRKSTVVDGDLHKIAKAKRLERAHAVHEAAVLGKHFKADIPYTFVKRKSRPIPSRPFPTRKPRNGHA